MAVYLIRHAMAGPRSPGPRDMYRQLTDHGHAQATSLVSELEDAVATKVLSSPATRCAQTVTPLAAARRLEIDEQPDLWEGSRIDHVLALLESSVRDGAIVCTHGDIIPAVIETLAEHGVEVRGRGCEMASTWILEHDGRRWTTARHLSAP